MQRVDDRLGKKATTLITRLPIENQIGLYALEVLSTGGDGVIKILCRKRHGEKEISYVGFIVAVLATILYGTLMVVENRQFAHLTLYKNFSLPTSLVIIIGVFFLLMGITILVMGIISKQVANTSKELKNEPEFPGISKFFAKNEKNITKLKTARNLYEPMLFLVTGIVIGFIHYPSGIFFIVCALSYWLWLLGDLITGEEKKRNAAIVRYNNPTRRERIRSGLKKQLRKR